MGEAIARLFARLIWKQDASEEKRVAYQTYLAYYLLEHGYTEPVDFFARFTILPESVVIPEQYKFIKISGYQIVNIHCHGVLVQRTVIDVHCHKQTLPSQIGIISEVNCHNIPTMAYQINEIHCHG